MMLVIFLAGLACLLLAGMSALVIGKRLRLATWVAVVGVIAGSTLSLVAALQILLGQPAVSARFTWSMPLGNLVIGIDGLSAFFLLPISALSALGAIYGTGYFASHGTSKSSGLPWACYLGLVASMAVVVTAQNALLFILAWETMTLASFFLVIFEHRKTAVRQAGWIYLVATHCGTAFLLVMFLLLGKHAGSLDFDQLAAATPLTGQLAGLLFVFAVIGFGTKAGFIPLHVWLPEAHPVAPSHVSALMSGVMIKTGIYGLIRTLGFLGAPEAWWGILLLGIGLSSGILGVLFALAQHDLKRLLAYHSVENIGIITLGLGAGVLGVALDSAPLAVLGFAGCLWHVLNHALFKGLLFLAAGSVIHATGSAEIDRSGGLSKTMPWTATCFLVGALAISGLPPLNGFASEFLIYYSSLAADLRSTVLDNTLLVIIMGGLALIGGLAAACFTKAFGMVFLGLPRDRLPGVPHEAPFSMLAPMGVLAVSCLAVGLLAPLLLNVLALPVLVCVGGTIEMVSLTLGIVRQPLAAITVTSAVLLSLIGALLFWRQRMLARRVVNSAVTWDCGYDRPSARMQYSGSSFAAPLIKLFGFVLGSRTEYSPITGLFPAASHLATHTPDLYQERLYRPLFMSIARLLKQVRRLQHGKLQVYVLYIVISLLALLLWEMR
ncbi:MAG: hypothetical protein HY692_10300 [Cyanobacteria bacterium NC_groundwater_1444_Ag_S-0.65um_54_12]|nr:hypothetical protein [Cyanobacteria bacterium NC_groundwater_1444_Ag_S-0.65um_54_12]